MKGLWVLHFPFDYVPATAMPVLSQSVILWLLLATFVHQDHKSKRCYHWEKYQKREWKRERGLGGGSLEDKVCKPKCFGFLFEDDVESNQMAPGLWRSKVKSGSDRGGKVHRNSQHSQCFMWLMTHSPAHATKTMNEQQWLRRSPSRLYSYLWNFEEQEWKVTKTACGVQCLLSGQCLTLIQSSAPIQTLWLQPLGREGARDRGG